jgi:hypothetical protein
MSEIIWSSVTFTKDEFISARANILNDKIKACCHENGWTFMSNSDVTVLKYITITHITIWINYQKMNSTCKSNKQMVHTLNMPIKKVC